MENVPSSLPDAIMGLARLIKERNNIMKIIGKSKGRQFKSKEDVLEHLFHDITLTSALCAWIEVVGDFPTRISQNAIVPSTEQDANSSLFFGLHCT